MAALAELFRLKLPIVLACLLLVALQGHAENITLTDGVVLEDATVKGESPAEVIIEHAGGIAAYPRQLVPRQYWSGEYDLPEKESAPPAPQPGPAREQAARPAPAAPQPTYEAPAKPVAAQPAEAPTDPTTTDKAEAEPFLSYYTAQLASENAAWVTLLGKLPPRWVWILAIGLVIVITLTGLLGAAVLSLFASITRLPQRSYVRSYRIVWLSGVLSVLALIGLSFYAPTALQWPWTSMLLPLALGLIAVMVVYGMTPFRSMFTYLLFWMVGLGIHVGTAFLAYSQGQPVDSTAQQIEALARISPERDL